MSSTIVFDVLARDRASDKFDKIGDSATKSSGKLKKFAAVGAMAVGGAAIIAGKALFDMTKAAIEDEAAQAKLAKSLKNSAGATDGQVGSVERWISAQGKALGIADDELRPALGRLATATGDVGKAQDLTRLAMDISAGTGKNLSSVTEALAKAQNGSLGGLGRLGAATKDAEGKTLSFKQVTEDLAKLHGGQAATAAETTQGKFKRLQVQFDEVKETIGAKLIPVAEKLMDWLMDDFIPGVEQFNRDHGPAIKRMLAGVADAFRGVGEGLKWAWQKVLKPTIILIADALEKVASWAAIMLDALSKAPGMGWAAKAADKLRGVADKADAVGNAIKGIPSYKQVSININFLYPKGKPAKNIEDTDDWINNLGNNGRGRLQETAATATTKFYDAISDAAKKGSDKLDKVLIASRDRLRDKMSGVRDEMTSMSSSIASALNNVDFGGTLEEHLASLTGTNGALARLMAVFKNLKDGASKDYLSSLMQSGNIGLATALAEDPASLAQASALYDANSAMAKGLGDQTAQTVLGDRIVTSLETEMRKLLGELKDAPGRHAKKLREEIKDLKLVVEGLSSGQKAHLKGAW